MGELIEITTWPKHLNAFYKITSNALAFEVMGNGNAAIGLSRKPANDCDYWIVIGEGASRTWIKKLDSRHRETAQTPGIISMEKYEKFWLTWCNGYVRLGRDGYSDAIVSCANNINDLKYVTFSVIEQRNPVQWRFEIPPLGEKPTYRAITGGELHWVPYEPGQEPPEPLVGGFEREKLYIARAKHRGSLTPGKFVPSAGRAYVSWGGQANEKEEFEILCGFDGLWKPAFENKIPVGAFIAGYSEDALERLYIGRVEHEGHLIPGKVQPSHKTCYFSYQEREVGSKKYEVLVLPSENERCANKIFVPDRPLQDIEEWREDSDDSNYTDDEDL